MTFNSPQFKILQEAQKKKIRSLNKMHCYWQWQHTFSSI